LSRAKRSAAGRSSPATRNVARNSVARVWFLLVAAWDFAAPCASSQILTAAAFVDCSGY
jgi:hypothetical protein